MRFSLCSLRPTVHLVNALPILQQHVCEDSVILTDRLHCTPVKLALVNPRGCVRSYVEITANESQQSENEPTVHLPREWPRAFGDAPMSCTARKMQAPAIP